jgi:hypothetical protein
VPFWLNELIGGWSVSGLPNWHTGQAYQAFANAFVAGYANDAPAILVGDIGLLKAHVNGGKGGPVNGYADPTAALNAYTGPVGFQIGTRNNLRGPGYFNIDLGVAKTFPVYKDKVNLKFRVDAFNATNHPNFSFPGESADQGANEGNGQGAAQDITEAEGVPFGTISSTVTPPDSDHSSRVLQGSLRLVF